MGKSSLTPKGPLSATRQCPHSGGEEATPGRRRPQPGTLWGLPWKRHLENNARPPGFQTRGKAGLTWALTGTGDRTWYSPRTLPSLPGHRQAVLGAQPSWPPPRPHVSIHQHSGAPRPGPQVLGGASPSRRFQPERLPRRPRPPAQPSQRAGPAAKASPWWGPEMVPAFLISFYHVS